MTDIQHIPLDAISADALARDRTALAPDRLAELKLSILKSGLRQPIEVYTLIEGNERPFGLISGYRRLAAFRALVADGMKRFATIPAFVREPATVAEAMIAMVEENAIRAEVSPWEQAALAVTAWEHGYYETVDAAVDGLYGTLNRDRRRRLRSIASLVEELQGSLTAPETLSLRQLLRLAAAASRGYGDLMHHALRESRSKEPEAQWRLLLPILAECEDATIPDPRPELGKSDRPRRTYEAPLHRIRVRRELTPDGWSLHFTGRDARGDLIDRVFDAIDNLLRPI